MGFEVSRNLYADTKHNEILDGNTQTIVIARVYETSVNAKNDTLLYANAYKLLEIVEELVYQFEGGDNSKQEEESLNQAKTLIKTIKQ